MNIFERFFDFWGKMTHTDYARYEWFGKQFGVNWPIVTFVMALWAAMILADWIIF